MSILDDLEHVALIGGGFFADVKAYRHKDTGGRLAVKVLKSEFHDNEDYIRLL